MMRTRRKPRTQTGHVDPFPAVAGVLLLAAALPINGFAQVVNEISIPEPTRLGVAAAQDGAVVSRAGTKATLESDNATAEISELAITTASGDRLEGVRILFRDETGGDEIFLGIDEAAQLRDEMVHLQPWYEREQPCGAQKLCMMGVARCRPSQTEQQAFCPGYYSTPGGERGVMVSTPRRRFRFPAIVPADLSTAVDSVLQSLQ